jgi:hypothetical protein
MKQIDRVIEPSVHGGRVGDEADPGFAEHTAGIVEQAFESGAHDAIW